jgi:hypothetical protein
MNNIKWLDGKDASGQYFIEIAYIGGGKGYIKNASYEKICHYYNMVVDIQDVIHATLYNTEGKVVAAKSKMGCAA